MKIWTKKGKGKVKLTDEQMSAIMSGLAIASVHCDELVDPEVATSKETFINTSNYLLKTYAKSAGNSEKELVEAIYKAKNDYKKEEKDDARC
jgi:hypothetical protein